MFSENNTCIQVAGVGKVYMTFDTPSQRLVSLLTGGKFGRHQKHVALSDVSFEVRQGETVGIVGRNGSGKSTLLSIISGTLSPTSGHVQLKGRLAALLELGAGLNPELSGRENIPLAAQIYGFSPEEAQQRAGEIIEFSGIGEYIDQPVKTYSSGMFTRLAFAIIANIDADVLIIDEALAVGDAYFVQKCMRFLHSFCESGGTLLFVSHDMGSVTALCDRVIWLQDGRVKMDGLPKQVANGYLAELYKISEDAAEETRKNDRREAPEAAADHRQELLNNSNLRNDLQIISQNFDDGFGAQGAQIKSVDFVNEENHPLSWLVGGELVKLNVRADASKDLHGVIIGFVIKDKTGQALFGDNTYLSFLDNPVNASAMEEIRASFCFRMPTLPKGTYSVSVAISEGTQESHVVHDWIHDAVIFESLSSSIAKGLVGIPMNSIEMAIENRQE